MIKVYSHPRSGTHFIEAFLAYNFYGGKNLEVKPVEWGHWANRKVKEEGNPYAKLFGNHYFPDIRYKNCKTPKIYIYRDPRAVAYSIWNTENFLHPDLKGISFSEFLTIKLDWEGSPGRKIQIPQYTIAEHWFEHVNRWHNSDIPNLLIIKYEELVSDPVMVYKKIKRKFFLSTVLIDRLFNKKSRIATIDKPVGLLPNAAIVDSWRSMFSEKDEIKFLAQIPNNKYYN
jgi:bile-salt sulfotransferase